MKEQMEDGLYLLPNKKIIAKERIPLISIFLCWLGFNKTKMIDLYSMIKRTYHSPNNIEKMMAYSFPLEHDNFPKPEQYPYYYRLINGWQVEKQSIAFLKDGPLFSENSTKVLVHSKIFVQSLLQRIWKFIVAFGIVLGIVSSLLGIVSLFL